MLTIDHLRLQLPAGYEKRAASIARLVARELGRLPVTHSGRVEHLAVPQITLHGNQTDKQLAIGIARSIHSQMTGEAGGCHD
ncbi:MAG: hypothetical protein AUJ57_06505 [Zetaproteobacteria bacterium CG1_02_53_45]|nr:MAG: hypothetical protein AUJ57_06505 [Zetaproteobacteria bacterium CG1_02_53_45]